MVFLNAKQKWRLSIDMGMTILLLCQMAFMLIGETAHEWMGMGMFVLFVIHNILNWKWYRNLGKGKYTLFRTVQTIVNFLVLFSMLGVMISGIIMSRSVFSFLSFKGGMGFARILHMLAAYWGFLFMSVHIGLHFGMILGIMQKINPQRQKSKFGTFFLRITAVIISIFGIYAFVKNNLYSYLFVKSQFVFFDVQQPLFLFFMEYLSIMGLCICVTYYMTKLLRKVSAKNIGNKKK